MAKTYKEWEDEAKKSGYYDTFSDEDLNQIKGDVAYGDSMLASKKEWAAAESPEEKKAIEDRVANERLQRGYYNTVSGNGDGGYRAIGTTMNGINNAQPTSKYATVNRLIAEIAGDKFSYDPKTDKRYKLAEEYAQQAMAHQMAESALLTGGYGNSYAANIGQQVYTDYMNDAVSDMEDRAYAKWAAERENKYNLLNLVRDMEQDDYNRSQTERQWAYQEEQDRKTEENNVKMDARATVENYIVNTRSAEGLSPELIAATGWDDAYIDSLVTAANENSNADYYKTTLDKATTLAEYGNFDTFKNLGYTEDEIAGMENYFNNKNAEKTTEEKNPFDFSSVFTQLDNLGAQTYGEAVNFLMGANYSEKQSKAIANAYMMDTNNEIYDIAVNIINTAFGQEAQSDLLALLRESIALVGTDATEQIIDRLTAQGKFNDFGATQYKRLLGISTEGK